MVAVTVILAAVIGSFVIGMGDQVQTTAPKATFSFDFDHEDGLMITHDGGELIDTEVDDLLVINEGTTIAGSGVSPDWTGTDVMAGVSLEERIDTGFEEGDEIRVVWRDGATGESVTVARQQAAYDAPGAT